MIFTQHKRLMTGSDVRILHARGETDITTLALFAYSSEDPDHPLEYIHDGQAGLGGTRWSSARLDATERIVLKFDLAQHISGVIYEIEEPDRERTQEVQIDCSTDQAQTFRIVAARQHTFIPHRVTFEREHLHFDLSGVTHLVLTIIPNKRGSGFASLTALAVFGAREQNTFAGAG